jgi:hypothetical protein
MTIERKLVKTSGATAEAVYVEDVFSTYLYTGNGSTQTINNGIDLATKGGLVWLKNRTGTSSNWLWDTARGAGYSLNTNNTGSNGNIGTTEGVSFTSSGFSMGNNVNWNQSGTGAVSWTFRKQPKFFDIVTYTGNGVAGRQIAHALGSTPGMIIIKSTSLSTENWIVYHRSLGGTKYLFLNTTDTANTSSAGWNNTNPTSTVFTVSSNDLNNKNGATYVAYLFAHDAGGFGPAGTDNIISCGSVAEATTVNLGWEPQFVLFKVSSVSNFWQIYDTMRNFKVEGSSSILKPNLSDAESTSSDVRINSTGFTTGINGIYLAIRRGPMKTPTDATKVFAPVAATSGTQTTGFPVDFIMSARRTGTFVINDRMRGYAGNASSFGPNLYPSSTDAEASSTWYGPTAFTNTTFDMGGSFGGTSSIFHTFRRAPGFFDVVCYQATGVSNRQINHNLGVTPELMIVKDRTASGTWFVYTPSGIVALNDAGGTSGYNGAASFGNGSSVVTPTSTVFTVGTSANWSTNNYVAYLFASCPGVSKVGSYTGSGSTKQIDCGFAAGARFVLIKRTDSSGNWFTWDSSRGIVSGNDPYLLLNSTAAELTNTDYIDPYSAGFEISSSAPSSINGSGNSFIFLAVA